jgi:photosystem II stability/assembly factor-like uncharacterized protein
MERFQELQPLLMVSEPPPLTRAKAFNMAMRTFRLAGVLSLALLLSLARAYADGNYWTYTNGPGTGNDIRVLAVDSRGRILAGTWSLGGTVWRSSDNGTSWIQLAVIPNSNPILGLSVNGRDHIFASVYGRGVYRSTDDGASWQMKSSGLTSVGVRWVLVDKYQYVWVCTEAGLYRSLDNGETWNLKLSGSFGTVFQDSTNAFVTVGSSSHYRSTDGGITWTVIPIISGIALVGIHPDGSYFGITPNSGIFRSTDYGSTWKDLSNPYAWTGYTAAMTFNPKGHIFYAKDGDNAGVILSTDMGATWIAINTGLSTKRTIPLLYHPNGYAFVGTNGGGVYRSTSSTMTSGRLIITLNDAEDWGPTGPNARVELYNSTGSKIAQILSASNSTATFNSVPDGTGYYYRVYVNRSTPWGEQYWGEKTSINISSYETTSDVHTHNTPYMPGVSVYIDDTNALLEDGSRRIIVPGTRLRIELTMKNPDYPGALTTQVYAGLYLDRDKSGPYDISLLSSAESYAKGAIKKIIFYCSAPSSPGDYYLSAGAFSASSRYSTTLTDASGWHEPTFTVGSGLVAYYPFSGTTADASGNGNTGTNNGVTFGNDRFNLANHAGVFDGNAYVDLPESSSLLSFSNAISLDFWAKAGSFADQTFLASGNQNDYAVSMTPNGQVFVWLYGVDVPTRGSFGSRSHLQKDRWYNIAVIYDGAIESIYIDGILDTARAVAQNTISSSPQSENTAIGAWYGNGSFNNRFSGSLDDVRIYSRALRVGEIDTLFHEGGYPSVGAVPWKFANTGTSHTIIVPVTISSNISGDPLSPGDYIGVFYDSLGTLVCAGFERWSGSTNIAISAFGDDPTTTVRDGFVAGEIFKWKVFKGKDGKIYEATALYVQPTALITHSNTYSTNGISQLASLEAGYITHCLSLRQGWSLISTFVTPQSTQLGDIFQTVLNDMGILKNGAQKTYIPSVPVNSIGRWVSTEGYQIKMINARSLCISGSKILPASTPVTVPAGWSILPFLSDSAKVIAGVLGGISTDIAIVKDQDGKIYMPLASVDGIGTMRPGQAYQIKMLTARSVVFSTKSGTIASSSAAMLPIQRSSTVATPPWFFNNTGASHTIVIPNNAELKIDATSLTAGDYIGVFYDSSETLACAGYEPWPGTGNLAIAAFGDDATTPAKDGFAAGETFKWKIWRQSDSRAFPGQAAYLSVGSFGGIVTDTSRFNINGISALTTLKGTFTPVTSWARPTEYALLQNYPNPFNPTTNIGFIIPQRSRVLLSVHNALGELVAELIDAPLESGHHSATFDASGLPSGTYFYRLQAGDFVQSRKLVLVK